MNHKIESMTHLEEEVNKLITLHKSLHGTNGVEANSVSEDVLRQYPHLDRTSVLELSKHLIKEKS